MRNKKATVISVINYKGGVGKTVSTYNIGTGLRFLNNHSVLLIDLDPQCSLSTICLKALSAKKNKTINLADVPVSKTINSVIKDYLSVGETTNPNLDIDEIGYKNFYKGEKGVVKGLDFIPATMFDDDESAQFEKGLDDLEIDIVREYSSKIKTINLVTIIARFLRDTRIDEKYDFIIFDCPPANNIITQNALLVSDFYLIPTIMDDLSSNGIAHLVSIINNTIYGRIYHENKRIIDNCTLDSQYYYLKKRPELLGVFETLRKTQVTINNSRYRIEKEYTDKVFNSIIYHHKKTASSVSNGRSCFSENINDQNPQYSPHQNYGRLVLEILKCLGIQKGPSTPGINDWF
ncbi:MAG: AAA family ATPase [Paenibacillus sp.]|nr:AAA family ATPase [Paenibacillus sp.]